MAKGFKHGAGGGSPLNFQVVGGTTQPTNPKENTIWVNMDGKVDRWDFRITAPETPTPGMVWFETGSVSHVDFNVLKKQSLRVYPRTARVYRDGQWNILEAEVFTEGGWVKLVDYNIIYDYGVNAVVTGEWVNLNPNYCVLTIQDTGVMDFDCNNGMNPGSCRTANKINLTDKKTIWVDGHLPTHSGGAGVSTEENAAIGKLVGIKNTSDGIHSIDVTSLTGGYYFYVHAYNGSSVIRRIWME
jgi:hypothetical protein